MYTVLIDSVKQVWFYNIGDQTLVIFVALQTVFLNVISVYTHQ